MSQYDDPIPSNPDTGVVRGDDKPMPDRGTASGMVGMGASGGMSLDMNATNRMGSAYVAPDPAYDNCPVGDTTRFTASSNSPTPSGGTRIAGEWTDSDRADDNMPDDTRGLGSNQD